MSISPIFGYSSFVQQPQNFAYNGWGRVTWGMLKGRVQAIYPQAKPDQSGGLKILGSDLSEDYDLTFNFNSSQRLQSVDLTYHGVPSDADFMQLKNWLVDKFGQATSTGAWQYQWSQGQTRITLSRGHNLTITYSGATPNAV